MRKCYVFVNVQLGTAMAPLPGGAFSTRPLSEDSL